MTQCVIENYKAGLTAVLKEFTARAKLKALLLDDTYKPSKTAHSTLSDLQGEIQDPDYKRIDLKNVRVEDRGDAVIITADPLNFGDDVTLSDIQSFVIYADNVDGNPLVAYGQFSALKSSENSEFNITIPSGFLGVA